MKRKGDATKFEAESNDLNPTPGNTLAVSTPLQTPVSGKVSKAQKVSRIGKCSRAGSQTPASNAGELYVQTLHSDKLFSGCFKQKF